VRRQERTSPSFDLMDCRPDRRSGRSGPLRPYPITHGRGEPSRRTEPGCSSSSPLRRDREPPQVGAGTGVASGLPFWTVNVTNSFEAWGPFLNVCGVSAAVSHDEPGPSICAACPLT
jgi:hypothetical protein